jgi:hypothetical protein
VVLVDVQALARLHALHGDAGADQLGQPVEVQRSAAPESLELGAHRLRPGLGAEEPVADPERARVLAALAHGLADVERE